MELKNQIKNAIQDAVSENDAERKAEEEVRSRYFLNEGLGCSFSVFSVIGIYVGGLFGLVNLPNGCQ